MVLSIIFQEKTNSVYEVKNLCKPSKQNSCNEQILSWTNQLNV